jgi:hypothetical protein
VREYVYDWCKYVIAMQVVVVVEEEEEGARRQKEYIVGKVKEQGRLSRYNY